MCIKYLAEGLEYSSKSSVAGSEDANQDGDTYKGSTGWKLPCGCHFNV